MSSTTPLRSDKLKEQNLQLCLKELQGYLGQIHSIPHLPDRKKTCQKQIPIIHDTLFRLSRLLSPTEYFKKIALVGDFCMEHEMYTIAIKEFYDRVFAEKRLIDLSLESNALQKQQFLLEWLGIEFQTVLNRSQCVFYEILELDQHLQYEAQRSQVMRQLFTIQNLISSSVASHAQILSNHIFNGIIVLISLIHIIQNAAMWKESVGLLIFVFNLVFVELVQQQEKASNVPLVQKDHILVLSSVVKLLFKAHEQLAEADKSTQNLIDFLERLLARFNPLPEALYPYQLLIEDEIVSYLRYELKRVQLLNGVQDAPKDAGAKKPAAKKPAADSSAQSGEIILQSLQLTPTEAQSTNVLVQRIVAFIYPTNRSFFRHQLPAQEKFDTVTSYISFALDNIRPQLSLYRKHFGLESVEGDVPISKDMFSPEKLAEQQAPVDTKKGVKAPAKGKAAEAPPVEDPLTEDDIHALYEEQVQQLPLEALFVLCQVCFHYEQWEQYDMLYALLSKMIVPHGEEGDEDATSTPSHIQLFTLLMQFMRTMSQEKGMSIEERESLILTTVKSFDTLLNAAGNDESISTPASDADNLADAALILAQWMKKYFYDEPREKQIEILSPLFHVLQHLRVKNLYLLCDVGIRLARHLEQEERLIGALKMARFCLQEVCLKRVSVLYNEPSNSEFTVLEDMDHQTLYCLHAELVAHIYRIELKRGVQKKTKALEKTRQKELQDLTKKSENPHLFGKLYDRDIQTMRTLSLPMDRPLNSKNHEQHVLKSAGQNFYELAVANMLIANFRDTSADKKGFIRQSIDYLLAAEKYEADLAKQFAASSQSSTDAHIVLVKPSDSQLLIQVRSTLGKKDGSNGESIDLLDDDPVDFVVYGKEQNYGESAVSASDRLLVGTGAKWDPNQNILISELQPNQFYSFAAQQVDAYGEPLTELTANSMRYATIFPLPLVLCWCYITQTAHKTGSYQEALQSGSKVLEPYLTELLPQPLWELNPIKQMSLDPQKVQAKASTLLVREIIKCAEIIGDIHLKREKSSLPEDFTPQLDPNQLHLQISRMRICNYYFMSLNLAQQIKDSVTISNLAVKIDTCLSPLFTVQNKQQSQFLLDSLLFVMEALTVVLPKQYRSYKLQKAAASVILAALALCSNLNLTKPLPRIAIAFFRIYEQIYVGCVEDEKNPMEISSEIQSLVEEMFFNRLILPALLENKPASTHIDGIYFSLADSLKSSALDAYNTLNSSFKDHKAYARFSVRLVKEQLRNGDAVPITSKMFSAPIQVDNAKDKKAKPAAAAKGKKPVEVAPKVEEVPEAPLPEQAELELLCSQVEFNKLLTTAANTEAESAPAKNDKKAQKAPKAAANGKKTEPGSEKPSAEEQATSALAAQRKKTLEMKQEYAPIRLYPSAFESELQAVLGSVEFKSEAETRAPGDKSSAIATMFSHLTKSASLAIEFKQWRTLFNLSQVMTNNLDSLFSSLWTQDERVHAADIQLSKDSITSAFQQTAQGLVQLLHEVRDNGYIDANALNNFAQYHNEDPASIASTMEYDNVSKSDALGFELPWVDRLVDIDVRAVANFVSFTLKLLSLSPDRASALVELGESFNLVTNNFFGTDTLPLMIAAKQSLAEDDSSLQTSLQVLVKDQPKTLVKLRESRDMLRRYFSKVIDAFGASTAPPSPVDVIKNYEVTVALLRSKHEVPLLIQALNEMGDLYALNHEYDKAAFLWAETLDNCLHTVTTLDNFQQYVLDKSRTKIVLTYGVWNIAMAIISAAKLGKHKMRHEKDYHACTKACVLISELVMSLFSLSVQHPQRFCNFASYDVKVFIPELFADQYRCNARQFIESIQFAAHHLNKNAQYLRSLPVCSLYEFFALDYLRDIDATTDARLIKVSSLSELGCIDAAFAKLRAVLLAQNLPERHLNDMGVSRDGNRLSNPALADEFKTRLNQERSLDNELNQQVIRQLAELAIDYDALNSVYAPQVSIQIMLIHASLLRKLGGSDPVRSINTAGVAGAAPAGDKKAATKKPPAKGTAASDVSKDDVLQLCLTSSKTLITSLLEDETKPLTTDTRLRLMYELSKIAQLRGETQNAQSTATDALQIAVDSVLKGEKRVRTQLNLETVFDLYQHAAQLSFENGFLRHCRAICDSSIAFCENMHELLHRRHFELLRALVNHYLEVEDGKAKIAELAQSSVGFQEMDDLFIPIACTEFGHLYELESLFNIPDTWKAWLSKKTENEQVAAAESFYRLASDFLDRFLYDNGFFESVPENHELKRENVLVRNDAKNLLMRAKLKVGVMLMVRGEYQESLKFMESVDRVLGQCFGASASFRATFKLAFGRLHRHLINTPHNVEDLWGTKKMSSFSYTSDILKNEKAELTFLPPTKRLEDALNQAFAHSHHDHTTLRRALMELCYLYGCKIVHDTSVHSAHVLIALIYLLAAGRVTSMRNTLEHNRRQLLRDSGRDLSEAPPPFLSEAVQAQFKNMFNAQFEFLASNSLDEVNHLARGATQDAKNVLEYFVAMRTFLSTASPAEQNAVECRLYHTHKYLLRSCAAYASEILMTSVPDVKSPPTIPKGLVCIQFYSIDTGLYPERVSSSKQLSLAEKLSKKKEDVTMPLISMFYALAGNDHAPDSLPLMGMLSFEQELVQEMQAKILALRDRMEELNLNQIDKVDENSNADHVELHRVKENITSDIVVLLQNPSALTRKNTVDSNLASEPVMTLSLVAKLVQMFDMEGGLMANDAELATWLSGILSVYH